MAQRILVVDDDRQIVRLVQSYLQQSGFSVLTAYDGEEALHAIRREKPDLIVLDLMLPKRDGLDRTIDSHIKNLRKKIEADPARPEYLETVFGIGYRLREA